jgi:hypothetical protein
MTSIKHDYPQWTCWQCGTLHGRKEPRFSTWHFGKCDVCNQNKAVTEPRDFGHFPNWFSPKKNNARKI